LTESSQHPFPPITAHTAPAPHCVELEHVVPQTRAMHANPPSAVPTQPQHGNSPQLMSVPPGHSDALHAPPHTPLLHAVPGAQHPVPQGVPPFRQAAAAPRQLDVVGLAQATPAAQHVVPQRPVPAGQPQVPVAALTHAIPALQQQGPQGVVPAPHGALVGPLQAALAGCARPRPNIPASIPPAATMSARRRDVGVAIAFASSSN
jgi:hypothetical protein